MFGLTDTQILWIAILVLVLIINYQINDIRGQLKPRLKPKAEKALLVTKVANRQPGPARKAVASAASMPLASRAT